MEGSTVYFATVHSAYNLKLRRRAQMVPFLEVN